MSRETTTERRTTEAGSSPAEERPPEHDPAAERWKRVVVGVAMGLVVGGAAVFAVPGTTSTTWIAALLGLVGGGYVSYARPLPGDGIGTGLYATAAVLVAAPFVHLWAALTGEGIAISSTDPALLEAILELVGGPFLVAVVALPAALVAAGVGFLARRRASRAVGAD